MNEQYLWDKRGEFDPEIDRLESVLSELRFDPDARKLTLPVVLTRRVTWRRPRYLAIAAGIAMMVLGATFWLQVDRTRNYAIHPGSTVAISNPLFRPGDLESVVNPTVESGVKPGSASEVRSQVGELSTHPSARSSRRAVAPTRRSVRSEAKEGEHIKAELMLALRVAGEKLHVAQRQLGVNKPAGPAS